MNKNKAEINFTNNLQIVSSVITGGGKYCSNSIYNYVPKFNESFKAKSRAKLKRLQGRFEYV